MNCPFCGVELNSNNLVHHCDKMHAAEMAQALPFQTPVNKQPVSRKSVRSEVASEQTKQVTGQKTIRASMRGMRQKDRTSNSRATEREVLKAWVREQGQEMLLKCPVCGVEVMGRNMVRHWDQQHAKTVN